MSSLPSRSLRRQEMEDKTDQALLSHDNLDRASPDLWPEQKFLSSRQNEINLQTPPKYATDLDKEDLELIHDFGSLSTQQLMDKIKHLQNLAYQVGLEEAKEMTRGKFLNILGKR
ncbi:unnamed protein product [Calicophoron daubneyi]|uniref:Lin-52 homolog n=1 Tax=Calicophoron daubneyi TaxID=300641 RepID=A0AAV2T4H2_CALDB